MKFSVHRQKPADLRFQDKAIFLHLPGRGRSRELEEELHDTRDRRTHGGGLRFEGQRGAADQHLLDLAGVATRYELRG